MKKIILTLILISSFIRADFSHTSYDTVIDSSTGLEWHDKSIGSLELGYNVYDINISLSSNRLLRNSEEWNLSTTICEQITIYDVSRLNPDDNNFYLTLTDWRLPNQLELLTLVDYTMSSPTIQAEFTDTNNSIYWSSTSSIDNTNQAWTVDFSTGETKRVDKASAYNIRCVRAGQLPIL